jgi:hypothetical protein
MNIIELHYEGGMEFMVPLSTLLLINLFFIGKSFYQLYIEGKPGYTQTRSLFTIKFIMGFALSLGVFGQIIGLMGGFQAIEAAGYVEQAVLAGGLKYSSYTTIYGFCIFLLSSICYFFLKRKALEEVERHSDYGQVAKPIVEKELVHTKG